MTRRQQRKRMQKLVRHAVAVNKMLDELIAWAHTRSQFLYAPLLAERQNQRGAA